MSAAAIAILILSLTTAGGLGWGVVEHQGRAQDRETAAAALSACEAREIPQTVEAAAQGTTDALSAAMAPELAEVQARVELVRALPRAELTRAVIEEGSPQLVAAEAWMARCEAMQAIKETDRLGCGSAGQAVGTYQAAIEAQAACPEPVPLPRASEPE